MSKWGGVRVCVSGWVGKCCVFTLGGSGGGGGGGTITVGCAVVPGAFASGVVDGGVAVG